MWRKIIPTSNGPSSIAVVGLTTVMVGILIPTCTPTSNESSSSSSPRRTCSFPGCIFLPKDILHDYTTKAALTKIRYVSKDNILKQTTTQQALVELLPAGDQTMATLTLIGFKGNDPIYQINQDRAFVISPYLIHKTDTPGTDDNIQTQQRLMGVFDGHAQYGERVSEYSSQQFPIILAQKLHSYLQPHHHHHQHPLSPQQRDAKIIQALEETFVYIDKTAPAHPSGGCTASVILQMGSKLYIANAGDSKSFIVVHSALTDYTTVVYMTRDDKPDLPDELERIERMGGRVSLPQYHDATSRVLYWDTNTDSMAGLAMSRSLGDWDAGQVGVIPNPTIHVMDMKDLIHQMQWSESEDDVYIFAVSASDGMMDYVDAKTIAKTFVPALFHNEGSHPLTACEHLIALAAHGWQRAKDGTYRDDIAIAVQTLRTPPNQRTYQQQQQQQQQPTTGQSTQRKENSNHNDDTSKA
jgi:serine/threonine protein phosphatase PrpC